ncbi:MAG: zinc-binding alcohol dehydrogenase family protein [Gemmatimonadales bacterium]
MRAMVLSQPGPLSERPSPLVSTDVAPPVPRANELLVRVSVCGVCRTDLDLAEGRLKAPQYPLIIGHQVVGRVVGFGEGVPAFAKGDRVGVAWIHSACGKCRWCRAGVENLCPDFQGTGCHVNGGYAEYLAVPAAFAHAIPSAFTDAAAAPLLCAGAVGWRSLRLANLLNGEPLGITGFGASAHLELQLARRRHPNSPVYVFARAAAEREFARELGAQWTGDTSEAPPQPLGAIIDTTPAWKPVVEALRRLAPGGRLVINAIRKEDRDAQELLKLDYGTDLWMEREIKSVANVTRADIREFLDAATRLDVVPTVAEVPLEHANEALAWLRSGVAIRGARVLRVAADG